MEGIDFDRLHSNSSRQGSMKSEELVIDITLIK